MLRYMLFYLVNIVLVCEAAIEPRSYSTPGKDNVAGVVRSTMEGVWEVRIRDYVGQIPIAPLTRSGNYEFGFPQKLSFIIEEFGRNDEFLRESLCYYEINEPKEVIGDTVSKSSSFHLTVCHGEEQNLS